MSSDASSSSEVVVRLEDVSKCYHVYARPSHRLLQGLVGSSRKYYEEFWALRQISIEIRRGQTLGIIGRNGSGKSTLLQLIAQTLTPTTGQVNTHGRVAALLELGSGFNPEFTGRENVYLNAAILGLDRGQIDARMDSILAFSEIGGFIDQPVKSYSSGMVMRLAFSVMAHVDADVLIIDEALAVGDAFFVQKCMRFLREFKQRGTLLFVSHDDSAVTGLCERALWLEGGRQRAFGDAKDVVQQYLESVISERQGGVASMPTRADLPTQVRQRHDGRREWINHSNLRNDIEVQPFDPSAPGFGQMRARIVDVSLTDDQARPLAWVVGGESVVLDIAVEADEALERPIVGFYVKDRLGQNIFGDNTYVTTLQAPRKMLAGQRYNARFAFQMPRLRSGQYFVTAAVSDGLHDEHAVQHWLHEALALTSRCESWSIGLVGLPMEDITFEQTKE